MKSITEVWSMSIIKISWKEVKLGFHNYITDVKPLVEAHELLFSMVQFSKNQKLQAAIGFYLMIVETRIKSKYTLNILKNV